MQEIKRAIMIRASQELESPSGMMLYDGPKILKKDVFWLNDRANICRNGCEQWDTWGKLLLFPGLPRPQGAQEHLSYQLGCRFPKFRTQMIHVIK